MGAVFPGEAEPVQVWVGGAGQGRAGAEVGGGPRRPGFPLTSLPAQGEAGPSGLLPTRGKGKVVSPAASLPPPALGGPQGLLSVERAHGNGEAAASGMPSQGAPSGLWQPRQGL